MMQLHVPGRTSSETEHVFPAATHIHTQISMVIHADWWARQGTRSTHMHRSRSDGPKLHPHLTKQGYKYTHVQHGSFQQPGSDTWSALQWPWIPDSAFAVKWRHTRLSCCYRLFGLMVPLTCSNPKQAGTPLISRSQFPHSLTLRDTYNLLGSSPTLCSTWGSLARSSPVLTYKILMIQLLAARPLSLGPTPVAGTEFHWGLTSHHHPGTWIPDPWSDCTCWHPDPCTDRQ